MASFAKDQPGHSTDPLTSAVDGKPLRASFSYSDNAGMDHSMKVRSSGSRAASRLKSSMPMRMGLNESTSRMSTCRSLLVTRMGMPRGHWRS